MLTAVRTWLRDGSRNFMSVDAAVANLFYNGDEDVKAEGIDAIRDCLLAGCIMETPLAVFTVCYGEGEPYPGRPRLAFSFVREGAA